MNRVTMAALALGVFALAHTHPAAAQTAAERPGRSIELGVGESPSIAFWSKRSERTDLGLRLSTTVVHNDDDTAWLLEVGPALRWYGNGSGAFAPYTQLGADVSYRSDAELWGVGGRVGFGLDWFPVQRLSVGGHVGARVQYQDGSGSNILLLRTFSSGILLRLFF